ncbi:hypothetical protein GE253_24765 [Niveispirillum sp. SYP-B3756]|uniref:hypothetical protein n=1 Tax=Niveispirillum sp. SYP-B3756 TaxID=2662178 RepID=UPI0012916DCC|nr:hypothetical protein [Niveispirillum sp. SYP-B3756]MQP68536.1 hypothetical protein [Niveispirillum sp. SYP-B3756]
MDVAASDYAETGEKKKPIWRWPKGEDKPIIPRVKTRLKNSVDYLTWRGNEVVYPLLTGPLIIFIALCVLPLGPSPNPKWTQAFISVAGTGDLLIFAAFLAINLASKYRSIEDGQMLPKSIGDDEVRAYSIQWGGVIILVIYTVIRITVEQPHLPDINRAKLLVATFSLFVLFATLWIVNQLMFKFYLDEAARRLDQHLRATHYVRR